MPQQRSTTGTARIEDGLAPTGPVTFLSTDTSVLALGRPTR